MKKSIVFRGSIFFFLDDNLFANEQFAAALFDGLSGSGRIWQAAGTVQSILKTGLIEKAVKSGLRSLFVGFETLNQKNLMGHKKYQNLNGDYNKATKKLKDLGVMINGSFVFGMDDDNPTVFDKTVDWAVEQGITTATFHILTPYPGTVLYNKMSADNRLLHNKWDFYDTRHVVYKPLKMSKETLESGYWKAYEKFYRWSSIIKSSYTEDTITEKLRHILYAGGWKKFEPFWKWIIKAKQLTQILPFFETVLSGRGQLLCFNQKNKNNLPANKNNALIDNYKA